jgi:hypothetical protein
MMHGQKTIKLKNLQLTFLQNYVCTRAVCAAVRTVGISDSLTAVV